MQSGPYVAERLMPKMVAAYCKRASLEFQSFSDNWVLRVAHADTIKWVVGYKFDINGSAAGEVAQDKVATYAALNAANISVVPHYLVRSLPREDINIDELRQELDGMAVVAKPLEGTAGRDVTRYETADQALNMIRESGEPAWALSPYISLRAEYRFIILDNEVLLSYEKTNPHVRDGLMLFNLSLGAVPKPIEDSSLLERLSNTALCVIKMMALRLAAVDIVCTTDGEYKVLEVNDGISMEHYARESSENYQETANIYETIVEAMFK